MKGGDLRERVGYKEKAKKKDDNEGRRVQLSFVLIPFHM